MRGRALGAAVCCAAALALACSRGREERAGEPAAAAPAEAAAPSPGDVDDAKLRRADADPAEWLTTGRTYGEQRYSPLDQITAENVSRLHRVWTFETGLARGHEATPLVHDGVLFFTGSWSVVFAVDARTGRQLWRWDPEVDKLVAAKACCDVVNRGVALYQGRVYVGVLDGRLVALDEKTGTPKWSTWTIDQTQPYTITGAPRVVDGKVIIGNGGAEFGVRGYVSAYEADSGKLAWRTYTVPGDPAKPQESKALEAAAKTWTGEWWQAGGGGTAWDSFAYDPELKLLYVGTGNGSPWSRKQRSPDGGDDLFLSSILALDPGTGEIVWHYQTTPGDGWDFTATQHMILADLKLGGRTRAVLMQAPKNGFFYVLDRKTGELLSAEKYVGVTWAAGIDRSTGRPIEVGGQDYRDGLALVRPSPFGGHNWQPMSFSPKTGLVYIPTQEILGVYRNEDDFKLQPGRWNTGIDFNVQSLLDPDSASGALVAWDPVSQKEVWRHPYALPWNGGVLSTGGNLVFEGTADGRFVAYRSTDGAPLWEDHAGTGVMAGPVTYVLDGKQYVSVLAGWGGAFGLAGGEAARGAGGDGKGRLLTFALSSGEAPAVQTVLDRITAPGEVYDGERTYHKYCSACHGAAAVAMVGMKDLRKLSPETRTALAEIVLKGALKANGMPAFADVLKDDDVAKLRAYLDHRAEESGLR
ncbi:MAG TPA: PQQ-dependent dehydrogenase, methanol/ethanol family [Myxococcota bacterium]|nr:PQQ-dependent dehydrogenase, methanol/ethanol family [Myxococcota bacterium]